MIDSKEKFLNHQDILNEIFKYLPLPKTLQDTSLVNWNFQHRVKSFVCWFYNKNHSDIKIQDFSGFVDQVLPLSYYARSLIFKNICNISQAKRISDFSHLNNFEKLKKIMEEIGCNFSQEGKWLNKNDKKFEKIFDCLSMLYVDINPKNHKERLSYIKEMFEELEDFYANFWCEEKGFDFLFQAICEDLLSSEEIIRIFYHWDSQSLIGYSKNTSMLVKKVLSQEGLESLRNGFTLEEIEVLEEKEFAQKLISI